MSEVITSVGIDAHKRELHVAMLIGSAATPVTWTVENEPKAIDRLHRKLEREAPGPVRVCYEAGPCGYALQRRLTAGAVTCVVIAPALMPRKPGDRVKTDKRDARKLAELFRAGLLTEVRPPTPAEEAVRDLCRARDDARDDVQRARHRLGKLLLRRGPALRGAEELDEGASAVDPIDPVGPRGRTCRRRGLPPGARADRKPPHGARCAPGGDGPDRSLSRAGGVAAVLPRHRYLDGDADPGGVARLPPLCESPSAHGVSRPRAQ